jgi:hypothetical protein
MKQRYAENFLFPQGQEDFGRSLVFPQGNLHGLASTTEQTNLTYAFLFPQGETEDYGRALMFPQGQLHGLGSARGAILEQQIQDRRNQAAEIADRIKGYQANLYQGAVATLNLQQATDLLKRQGYYQPGMTPETVAATAHALNPDVYVSGAGTGYGTVGSEANPKILAAIDEMNQEYQYQLNLVAALQQELQIERAQEQAAAAAAAPAASVTAAAPAAAAAAAAAAVTTNPATVTKTITTVATTTAQPPATNVTYVLDFYNNQFWLKRSDGVAIANGSADWKSAALFIAPYNLAIANVSVTPAAAAKFASNSGTTTGATASSTGVTATSGGTATGVTTTTTTNQTTGTTTVTNTATGVTATTSPVTGTTTVSAGSTVSDTGKLALYALLGVLLLRGAVR